MPNRLADAISPYLRSHADNPVDWYEWGEDAFAEARERGVPVLVSIGYSTCHWCHVMARETFSDPGLASYLNERFVSIKVDREEHPDVDASYLAAASAFTQNLGWPLNVFVTPEGKAFYAGTYFPPQPMQGHPSFRQVLTAMTDAWSTRREEVAAIAASLADAIAKVSSGNSLSTGTGEAHLPEPATLGKAVSELAGYEDTTFGGFGSAPKFPATPTLGFLLSSPDGEELALRTLKRMGASPLRDSIEGGFFRYAVNRDWSEPHYERMLYDNAQLLDLYTRAWNLTGDGWARFVAEGIARFLLGVMQLPGGGFASAQDSESTVAGVRTEGGYYALDEDERAVEAPPALDEKVLTGWNGLAIGALARAGYAFGESAIGRPSRSDPAAAPLTGSDLVEAARRAADALLQRHQRPDGTLVRASIGNRASTAQATLEDYGMFAGGLLQLALATGEVHYATQARRLIDLTAAGAGPVFTTPNGIDPVLAAQGVAVDVDPSEGAYPSGMTATARAAYLLYSLTGDGRYRNAAANALAGIADLAPSRPLAFGGALELMRALASPARQLVVVTPDPTADSDPAPDDAFAHGLVEAARRESGGVVASVTASQAVAFADAGFDLFADRVPQRGLPTAYFCSDFVCRLPVTDAAGLALEREARSTAGS
jgi:uncharacterized protein YyaL (SSP411 family)